MESLKETGTGKRMDLPVFRFTEFCPLELDLQTAENEAVIVCMKE